MASATPWCVSDGIGTATALSIQTATDSATLDQRQLHGVAQGLVAAVGTISF